MPPGDEGFTQNCIGNERSIELGAAPALHPWMKPGEAFRTPRSLSRRS